MPEPHTGELYGLNIHYTVGVILTKPGTSEFLLAERRPDSGRAGISGHINEDPRTDKGEDPFRVILREVAAQTRLTVVQHTLHLAAEQFMASNRCSLGVTGHYWKVYQVEALGTPVGNSEHVKSLGWYPKDQLPSMYFEPVWRHWFTRLGLI